MDSGHHSRRRKHPPSPLDTARLEELALAHVARFATSAARLEAYLRRKLRERGWEGQGPPDPAALVARCARLGYVDDEAYARARSGGLLRRGYGGRRIALALAAAGIDPELGRQLAPSAAALRRAALALARRRRFGPFGGRSVGPQEREKQIAAMLRAGHDLEDARALVDAPTPQAAERWAAQAMEDGAN